MQSGRPLAAGRAYDPQLHHVAELGHGTATSVGDKRTAARVGRGTVSHDVVPDLVPWLGGPVDRLG